MTFLAVALLGIGALAADDAPTQVVATTYYRTFSHSHPILKTIQPGEIVATKTIDSGGVDEAGETKSEPFNPLTGPFAIAGAEPGDALVVHLRKVRLNRDWGWSAYRLGLFALTPESVEHVYASSYKPDLVRKGRANLVPWDIDLKRQTVKLREPRSKVHPLEFPARPMLGCIGVAPAGDFAPTSGPSGAYGGNLDYNKIGEGARVHLPVYHKGGLLFLGDGHALQADGEPTGTGIETSMAVEFSVELIKNAKLTGPRVETDSEIISLGSQPEFASALDNGLKTATSDMAEWLTSAYGLEPFAAHMLIGYQGRYDVVTVAGTMALAMPKSLLKALSPPIPQDKPASAPAPKPTPGPIAEKTKGLKAIDGFLPLYWDESAGKVYLEITRFDTEFLYQIALATGLGSNPVGLDRGQLGDGKVVVFQRVGPKVLLVEPNPKYRALTDHPAERRAVEESFARSVLWGFKVEAEEAGRVLVDATPFFLRDAHGVSDALRKAKQGAYKLDDSRGTFEPGHTKGFPKNTEVEALLTFVTDGDPGDLVSDTAPAPKSVSVRQRHSFVALPPLGPDFRPRKPDPRVGVFAVDFYDFATPLLSPVERQFLRRHRLAKKDPKASVSDPVAPIVYYVDPGAPEPVRSALVEGASWWSRAFLAAGFRDAFRVEVLPDGADPMDLRYNVIQWVHRSTRGWSYGSSVVDPRTGEILKGRVTLDSLRARQDALIGKSLVGRPAMADGDGRTPCAAGASPGPEYLAGLDPSVDTEAMVLARIRQLSAHEVGHTLGLAHNFAASTYDRGSVMDYPAPLVKITNGAIDLSDAYAKGLGPYDDFAIQYAYAEFSDPADELKGLAAILHKGLADNLLFISDADARPPGAAHPLASLWDNGPDPIARLRHEMEVRKIGLASFSLDRIADGTPLSELEMRLLPLYLHHRYQLTAAVKSVGGANYTYAVKDGDKASPPQVVEIVPAARQRDALHAVLDTLNPDALAIPDRILALIPPRAFGQPSGVAERFDGSTGPVFDPLAAATIAAELAVDGLLQPQRAARLVEFHARDARYPGFEEVASQLVQRTWRDPSDDAGKPLAIRQAVQHVVVNRLIALASDDSATDEVRAIATDALRGLPGSTESAHRRAVHDQVQRFLRRPDPTNLPTPPIPTPPGDPIGASAR